MRIYLSKNSNGRYFRIYRHLGGNAWGVATYPLNPVRLLKQWYEAARVSIALSVMRERRPDLFT